ncbi:MAG: energy transducer TonB [Bacteroidales bacterium]|nr:energy transducer TonB [Bacteroidales bacterium]
MNRLLHLTALMLLLMPLTRTVAQIHPPEYPGGDPSLATFLMNNLKYPTSQQHSGITGRVYVTLTIDTGGNVVSPSVAKGLGEEFDAEALRVVRLMPKWKPARDMTGRPIAVTSTLPINFIAPKVDKRPVLDERYWDYDTVMTAAGAVRVNSALPEFPGGNQALEKFIEQHLDIPYNSETYCGTVVIYITVNANGQLSDIKYPTDIDEECLMALHRLMNAMPRWRPGHLNGVPTRMSTGIPITFRYTE